MIPGPLWGVPLGFFFAKDSHILLVVFGYLILCYILLGCDSHFCRRGCFHLYVSAHGTCNNGFFTGYSRVYGPYNDWECFLIDYSTGPVELRFKG